MSGGVLISGEGSVLSGCWGECGGDGRVWREVGGCLDEYPHAGRAIGPCFSPHAAFSLSIALSRLPMPPKNINISPS
jgi:hypothetical protein